MNEPQTLESYLGHQMRVMGISYQCPSLKLYGYRDELDLARGIYRTLAKRGQLPADAQKPSAWFDGMMRRWAAERVAASAR